MPKIGFTTIIESQIIQLSILVMCYMCDCVTPYITWHVAQHTFHFNYLPIIMWPHYYFVLLELSVRTAAVLLELSVRTAAVLMCNWRQQIFLRFAWGRYTSTTWDLFFYFFFHCFPSSCTSDTSVCDATITVTLFISVIISKLMMIDDMVGVTVFMWVCYSLSCLLLWFDRHLCFRCINPFIIFHYI